MIRFEGEANPNHDRRLFLVGVEGVVSISAETEGFVACRKDDVEGREGPASALVVSILD